MQDISATGPNVGPKVVIRSRIYGSGEMAELTRNFDWSITSLGPIETWPDTLVTTVNLMLATRHPMFLWWGPELIQFYNDGYRPTIRDDKHPKALGQRGVECWPEIWPIIGPQIEGVMERGQSTWHRNALVPIYRNGILEDVYWTYSYSPVRDRDGVICGTLVVCSDTTEEVLGEQRLRQSEGRFRQLIEQANVGVVIGDLTGNITYLNPIMLRILGYSAEEVSAGGLRWDTLTPPEFKALDETAIQQLIERGACDPYEKAYVARDGRRVPLLLGASMIAGAPGRGDEIAVFITDLSVLKQTENALRQAEKLAAVGRLASSIAHEINNPLESVTNLLFLIEHAAKQPDLKQYAATAQAELSRVSQIAIQTLRFHRQSTLAAEVQVGRLVRDVLHLYAGRIANAGVVIERQEHTDALLMCYDADLRQVFANLIGNAIDACRPGQRVSIRTREAMNSRTGQKGIRVIVADTGCGMDENTQKHMFDPFFTTKGETSTGLGLWVSAEILQKHHAAVKVRSRQQPHNHGTVISIFFPFQQV